MATNQDLIQKRLEAAELRRKLLARQKSVFEKGTGGPPVQLGLPRAALQGLTFGLADELGAGAVAGARALTSKDRFKDVFDDVLFNLKLQREQFSEEHPVLTPVSEIAGAAAQGGGLLSLANRSLRNAPTAVKLATVGGLEGGAFGFGQADPGERITGAKRGLVAGGIGGPLAGGAFALTGSALRPVARKLGEALFDTPRGKAVRIVKRAMDADDITPEEASILLRRFGPDATLADLGENLGRSARVATSQTGPSAGQARRFFDERQLRQQNTLVQAARRATGADDFDRGIIDIVNNAETAATAKYKEAYETVIDVTPGLADAIDRAGPKVFKKASTKLKRQGFSTDIVDDVTDVRYLDAMKRAIDDEIGVARRAGRNDDARIWTQLKNDFLREIDPQAPAYKEARNIFSGEASLRDAADFGRNILRKKTDIVDASEVVKGMTDSELQAFRTGFLRDMADTLSNARDTSNAAKGLAETPKFRQLLNVVFPDQGSVDNFLNTAQAQSRFSQTRNTVLGGSPTARIQQDIAGTSPGLIARIADSFASPTAGISNVLRSVMTGSKLTPEVLDEMGKILLRPGTNPLALNAPRAANLFNVPQFNPTTFSGVVGGGVGSLQEELVDAVRPFGLLGN